MYERKNLKRTIWVLGTVFMFLVAAPLYANKHEQKGSMSSNKGALKEGGASQLAESRPLLFSANNLIGSVVKTHKCASMSSASSMSATGEKENKTVGKREMKTRAEKLGTVGELAICSKADKVAYVILNSGGKHYPVPWWAFEVRRAARRSNEIPEGAYGLSPAGTGAYQENWTTPEIEHHRSGLVKKPVLFLNISPEQLRQAPTVGTISIKQLSNTQLSNRVNAFYCENVGMEKNPAKMSHTPRMAKIVQSGAAKEANMPEKAWSKEKTPTGSKTAGKPGSLLLASKINGLDVRNANSEELGKIRNLLIDSREGYVAYGLVNFGGFLGIGEKTAAVPWTSLHIRLPDGYARLDVTRETLSAAAINKNDLRKLAEPKFARRVYNRFGATPYWEVLGFVPGEEQTKPAPAPKN